MAPRQRFFVKYLANNPVKIDTIFIGKNYRKTPLNDVVDLIYAVVQEPITRCLLGLPDKFGPLTLHLSEAGEALDMKRPLSSLGNEIDLIIKCTSSLVSTEIMQVVSDELVEPFQSTAEKLKDDQSVVSLVEAINEIRNSNEYDFPFIFLNGSSGRGKTQMAFNLAKAGQKVHFIVCVEISDISQDIYICHKSFSDVFLQCVEADMSDLKDTYCSTSFFKYCLKPLHTFGFIYALLDGTNQFPGSMNYRQVADKVKKLQEKHVFFLDEFPKLSDDRNVSNKNKLRFMRNIFRSLGLVVILSSTNSSAINLFSTSQTSRCGDPKDSPRLWCHVHAAFPKPHIELDSEYSHFKCLIDNSRPLFGLELRNALKVVSDNLSPAKKMDKLMLKVAQELKNYKIVGADDQAYFLFGQVCLFLSASYISPGEDKNSMLIHRHFANLYDSESFPLYLHKAILIKDDEEWSPNVKFPELKDDILLYLSLMGGGDNHAIQKNKSRIPYARAVQQLDSELIKRLDFGNPVQFTNDGMRLEAITAGSIVVASHENGFAGIPFNEFIQRLMYELDLCQENSTLEIPDCIKKLLDFQVPYLSPPNQKWPEYMEAFGLNLRNFKRTRNQDRIDFSTDPILLTGECKDYQADIDTAKMKDILLCVPSETQVHIVTVNRLGKTFFKNESFEEFAKTLPPMHIYQLALGNQGQIYLKKIKGILNGPVFDSTVVVIIIEMKAAVPVSPKKKAKTSAA